MTPGSGESNTPRQTASAAGDALMAIRDLFLEAARPPWCRRASRSASSPTTCRRSSAPVAGLPASWWRGLLLASAFYVAAHFSIVTGVWPQHGTSPGRGRDLHSRRRGAGGVDRRPGGAPQPRLSRTLGPNGAADLDLRHHPPHAVPRSSPIPRTRPRVRRGRGRTTSRPRGRG